MNTSELIGKEVLDKSGNKVGKVVDIDINFPQWTVNHLHCEDRYDKESTDRD